MTELKTKLIVMDKAGISSFLRDNVRDNQSNYKNVLKRAYKIKVTNKKLDELREQFYIQVAHYKLNNNEPYFTTEEVSALDEARTQLFEINNGSSKEIKEIQENIESFSRSIQHFTKEYSEVYKEVSELENSIENLCEQKALYIKNLEGLQEKYDSEPLDPENLENFISKEDLLSVQNKIRIIDENLKEMTKEYINKVKFN